MPKLYVDQTIEIDAPPSRVWEALTRRELTDRWSGEFSSGGPRIHLESSWTRGAPVLWKDDAGKVIVEGNVTALEPARLLRFTVFDTSKERPVVSETDGITFELTDHDGRTTLQVRHGDFSVYPEGEKYQRMSAETWDRVLPKIRELATQQTYALDPTR